MRAALPGCHQLHRRLISGRREPETTENGNDGEIQIPIPEGKQGDGISCSLPAEELSPYQQRQRIRWAQLIRRVWLEDPLLCAYCGGEMRILAFLTDPPVVDKILRHVGWYPGEPAPDLIRAPPTVLKVAESLPDA